MCFFNDSDANNAAVGVVADLMMNGSTGRKPEVVGQDKNVLGCGSPYG
jgi:hypothetical protein